MISTMIIAILLYFIGVVFCFVFFFLTYGPGVSLLEALRWPLLIVYVLKSSIQTWYKNYLK